MEVRLAALFERYDYASPVEGCPDIITGMALDFIPAFQIRSRKKLPVSGAPVKQDRWGLRAQAIGELKRLKRAAQEKGEPMRGLAARAAENVHRQRKRIEEQARRNHKNDPSALRRIMKTPTAKTIQNLMSLKIPFPHNPDPAIQRAQVLLWLAEKRLRARNSG